MSHLLHHGCTIQCFPLCMFLLVETALKVWPYQLTWWENLLPQVTVLSGPDLHHQPTLGNNLLPCFYLNLLRTLEITKLKSHLLFMLFFPYSWCSSSRQRMGWLIFWRLVPGRRGITGQATSSLWSTSCGQPEAARWQSRKTLLDPSYTRSIWGEPCKQKLAHRLCSIVRMLNPVFSLSYPAFVSACLWLF